MSTTPAPSGCFCTAPTPDHLHLCSTHEHQLRAELVYVHDHLVTDLEVTRTRQDRAAVQDGGRVSGERALDWNERAAQAEWELRTTVNAWALDVSRVDEDGRDPLAAIPEHDVPELARWLVRNLPTLRRHPEACTAFDELIDTIRRARRVTDLPATSSTFVVGPCPEDDDDGAACGGEVWAHIATGSAESYLRCTWCDTSWDSTRWLRTGRRILARLAQRRRGPVTSFPTLLVS